MNIISSTQQPSSINKIDNETNKLISSQVSSADEDINIMLSCKNATEIKNYDLNFDNDFKPRFNNFEEI